MSAEQVRESREKFDPLNEPIYAIFYTKYDGTGNPHDAFLSFRRDYFKGGKRNLRVKKRMVMKGFPGEIKGKITSHSIKWKIKMGSIDTEQSFQTQNGYILVKRGYNKTLISRIYFDKEHQWQKSEYFKPGNFNTSKPQIVLIPIEWRSKIELQELNEESEIYNVRTLYPSSYYNSSPSQNVVDTIYGKPPIVLYTASGVYCYCTEENTMLRQNAMEEINQSRIFMSSSWQVEDGEFLPKEKKDESAEQIVTFKDMQHTAEIRPADEEAISVHTEPLDLKEQPQVEVELKETQQDNHSEEKPKIDNILEFSTEGSKEMIEDKKVFTENPIYKSHDEQSSPKPAPETDFVNARTAAVTDTEVSMDDLRLDEDYPDDVFAEPVPDAEYYGLVSTEPTDIQVNASLDKPEEAIEEEPDKPEEDTPVPVEVSPLEDKTTYQEPQLDDHFSSEIEITEDNKVQDTVSKPEEISAPETTDTAVESAFDGDFKYPSDVTPGSAMDTDQSLADRLSASDDLKMPEITSSLSDMHSKPNCENWEDGHVRIEQDGITAYEGGYKDSKRHGFGSYYYRDGMLCYAGFWNEGEKQGLGVSFRHDDQALHVSNWQNNQPVGFISLFDPNGNFKYGGKMTDGKKDGVGVSYDNDEGTVFVGKWKDGEYTGYGSVFDENGILMYSGMWKDGKRHGTGTSFDQNGEILFFGEWRDGDEYKGVLFKHVEP